MKLTRTELLVLLIEECSEVQKAAAKCLRFGYDVDHNIGYGNNKAVMSREVGELLAVIDELSLNKSEVNIGRSTKIRRAMEAKAKYGAWINGDV